MNRCKRGERSTPQRKKRARRDLHCIVHLLDNTCQLFRLDARYKAEVLFHYTAKYLDLVEPKYFGLSLKESVGAQRWLQPDKTLRHQLKRSKGEVHLKFEVKYYVENPSQLVETQTRHFFFLQLWKNIVDGTLSPSPQTACLLTSYYFQAKVAATSEPEDADVAEMLKSEEVPKIAKENASLIVELHRLLRDQSVDQAQTNFLDHARRIELYGVDLHPAEDCRGKKIEVGICSRFVSVYRKNIRVNGFSWCKIVRISYKKKRFFIQLQREKYEDFDTVVGFRLSSKSAAKALWRSCIEQHSFFRLGQSPPATHVTKGVFPLLRKMLAIKSCYTVSPGQPISCRAKKKNATIKSNGRTSTKSTYRRYDHLHKIQSSFASSPKAAWSSAPDINRGPELDLKNFTEFPPSAGTSSPMTAFVPSEIHQGICFADEGTDEEFRLPLYLDAHCDPVQSPVNEEYEVHLMADISGVFGFNIRFVNGSSSAAFLSRIVPNSPADNCYPPLKVGDELIAINGQPLESLSQQDVIEMFRSARQSTLTLFLRRSGWNSLTDYEEPIEFVCDGTELSAEESVAFVAQGLQSGRLLSQFELLPRSRPELSCNVAKLDENLRKNRYGDIFPYDCNRVKLPFAEFGDYINASFVNIPLPGNNNILRYIAMQGPLPHTVEDFWSVVWSQNISLIAMVTPEVERGVSKCHRYWPDIGEIVRVGDLVICCQSQQHFGHFVHNQFMITNSQSGEARTIDHVQYLDWPDHGVPISATHFLDYVRFTRSLSYDDQTILVHCSAGIGRTGAFILLDASLCLLQANQTVNPITLVRIMRDQRPMMIQTSMQFQYVCECIIDSLH